MSVVSYMTFLSFVVHLCTLVSVMRLFSASAKKALRPYMLSSSLVISTETPSMTETSSRTLSVVSILTLVATMAQAQFQYEQVNHQTLDGSRISAGPVSQLKRIGTDGT